MFPLLNDPKPKQSPPWMSKWPTEDPFKNISHLWSWEERDQVTKLPLQAKTTWHHHTNIEQYTTQRPTQSTQIPFPPKKKTHQGVSVATRTMDQGAEETAFTAMVWPSRRSDKRRRTAVVPTAVDRGAHRTDYRTSFGWPCGEKPIHNVVLWFINAPRIMTFFLRRLIKAPK